MQHASTSRLTLTSGYQDFNEPSAHGSYFLKMFREPTLVDVRVILHVEDDKMDEYIHPHRELEILRVWMIYMCMRMMDMDVTCINK